MANEQIIKIKPAFEDARGVIANIIDKPISHIAIITSKKGAVRANHYHPKQMQYEYLISGGYTSYSKDLRQCDDAPVEETQIVPGDLVITEPNIAHAMKFTEDSVMLNITDGNRDTDEFDKHTIKYQLIEPSDGA